MMDLVAASEAVAGLLASGAAKQLGEDAGSGMATGIVSRIRKLFGSDARSMDALEKACQDDRAAISDLASALTWYAQRDQAFATELIGWASQARAGEVTQRVHAGRDAYTAGRDQTVPNNYRRSNE
jgi:hypothetical protein